MKKIILPVVAVMLCMTGCKKEQDGFLRLEVENFNSDAKMHIDVEGAEAYSVWDDGDLMKVNGTVCTVSVGENSAVIGNLPATEEGAYGAVYPASIVEEMLGNAATVKLPAVQQYREKGGQQVVEVPMTAYCGSGENTLSFRNLGSLLAVKVENDAYGDMKVWRIRVGADKPLCGTYNISDLGNPTLSNATATGNTVYLDFDKGVSVAANSSKVFYIALPPVTGAQFTIEVYSSNTMYQRSQSTATATFARSTAHEVPFSTTGTGVTTANIMLYESTSAISCGMSSVSNIYDSDNKMGYFTFSSPVAYIAYNAFEDCTSLTSVVIPEGVTEIGNVAFSFCSSLISINIPNGVTSIKDKAFSYCSSLISVVIPNGVTSIEEHTFEFCSSLTSIDIPESVTSIGAAAFSNCRSLTRIDIPARVTSIGGCAFSDCWELSCINCWPQDPPSLGENAFQNIHRDAHFHVLRDDGTVFFSYKREWNLSSDQLIPDLHL